MTRLITRIVLALCTNIDSVLAFFEAYRTRLNQLSAELDKQAIEKRREAAVLTAAANHCETEAARGRRVSQRVAALLD